MQHSATYPVNMSIGQKIFATIFLTSAVLVILMLGLIRISLGRGFGDYVNRVQMSAIEPIARDVERSYTSNQQWWLPPPPANHQALLAIVDPAGQLITGTPLAVHSPLRHPLWIEGRLMGYLATLPADAPDQDLARAFLHEQLRTLALIGVLALAVTSVMAALLVAHLRKAIQGLVEGTQRLAQGEFTTRIPVSGSDELGQLAARFNRLAATLERGAESRKQWIADVSHELRTPLAVLRAEVEALQDGVRPANAEAFELLHGQVLSLSALTDDLFQLARSDLGQMNYKMKEVDLWRILREATEQFQSRFQRSAIELSLVRESNRLKSNVWGDADRLRQLLNNFLENSLRYTHAPGRAEVRCQSVGSQWVVLIDDSAPGVAPEVCEKLFERFFRVESSRSKQLGGAGLGLAICRNIAQAHGGQLRAGPSPLGGLRLELILPCYPR